MRICYVCSFKENSGGGISQVVVNLSNYFSKDHGVLIVLPGDETRYFYDVERNMHFLEVSSMGEGLLYVPRFRMWDMLKIYRVVKDFSPELIHFHDEGPIPLLLLAISADFAIHNVLTFHTDPLLRSPVVNDLITNFGSVFSHKNNKKLSRLFGHLVDLFCIPSYYLKESLFEIVSHRNIYYVSNMVNLVDFKIDMKRKKYSLVFIGHVVADKGCDYLIEVMRYLPPKYKLALVGDTPNLAYLGKLQQKIKKYNLKNINFLGKVPHAQISEILAKSHLFVSASLLEVQSLAILEALASGTPVVALSNTTTDEFVDETVGYKFLGETPPSDFAQKIQHVCRLNFESYQRLSRNSRHRVSRLAPEFVGSKTLGIYRKLLLSRKNKTNKLVILKYVVLAVVFAKYVQILYFLEKKFTKYEKTVY